MSAKKLLFVLLLIMLISIICNTAEAVDNISPAGYRYGVQLTMADGGAPSTQGLRLSNPYWDMLLDAAGYSDYLGWGLSPRPHVTGEMLSGEWGAAIYYDGIGTAPNAMWLTDRFIFPNWFTNSDFEIFEEPNAWDDPCNPVVGNDTGYSVIRNGQVEVRIDYEIVDLGEQDANTGEGGSPLAFRDANGMPVFVYSERYVLLQTYTITNIGQNDINNLEFYQMVVGLTAYHSFYGTLQYNDPLEDYSPYNAVHTVGNFHYDITQWDGYSNCIGFSSTVEPNVEPNSFDNGSYGAHSGSGTDWRIEQRILNGEPNSEGSVAGATGWYLGTPEPNESISMTVAIMVGAGVPEAQGPLLLEKVDDINDCVGPGDEITYTIDYNYPAGPNLPDYNDVNIIDHLPVEVDFNSAPGGVYHPDSNTVTWNIGTLHPGATGSVTLKVNVKCPQPGSIITNCCEIKSGEELRSIACEDTPVCSPTLTKQDNIPDGNCIGPGDMITYSICYAANGYGDTDVVIIDNLPDEVNFISASGDYSQPDSNTVIWNIGTLEPNESGYVELVVQVNTKANPLTGIINHCEMSGDCIHNIDACENTPVCCWYIPVIYVDANAAGANNGTSWSNAYKYLQDALEDASGGCGEIWVAAGTYKPDRNSTFPNGSGDRNATFNLISNVAVYGGFPSGGGPWESRNPNDPNNETILSGNIGAIGNNFDNSYHVVTGSGTDETAVLDGFTVTAGFANGLSPYDKGGGMYNYDCNAIITNCTFSENSTTSAGGGMYNENGSPTVTNCTFSQNSALSGADGSGMYNKNGNPIITNCTFSQNSASAGGGMYNDSNSNPIITNCAFSGNSAYSGYGGGMHNYNSSPTITNCILWDNSPEQIVNDNSTVSVTYSDIQGDLPWLGESNINVNPLFVDATNGNLRLQANSPCIDAGDNNSVPPDYADLDGDGDTNEPTPLDLDSFERFIDGDCNGSVIVDMGAYEFLGGDINRDGFVNFEDFAIFASSWRVDNTIPPIPQLVLETFESYTATGAPGQVGTLLGPRVGGAPDAWRVLDWPYGTWMRGTSTLSLLTDPSDANSGSKAMRWVYDVNVPPNDVNEVRYTEILVVLASEVNFAPYNELRVMLKRHAGNSPDGETFMYTKFLNNIYDNCPGYTGFDTGGPDKYDIANSVIGGNTAGSYPDEYYRWRINLDNLVGWKYGHSDLHCVGAIMFGIRTQPEGPYGHGTGTIDVDDVTLVDDLPGCSGNPVGDLNNDCRVNFEDLKMFALYWLDGI